MIAAKVPLRERNPSGRWAGSPNTADTVYGRTPFSPEADPLPQVPLGGFDGQCSTAGLSSGPAVSRVSGWRGSSR
jgi:hypothetical protein